LTIFTSIAFLVVAGVTEIKAGLFVGGVFFISIITIVFLLRKFKPGKNPINLGVVMLFFSLIYLATVLFVPAYLQISTTVIETDFPLRDTIPVFVSILIIIILGFILTKINTTETMSKIKGG
jgi:predicted transporter